MKDIKLETDVAALRRLVSEEPEKVRKRLEQLYGELRSIYRMSEHLDLSPYSIRKIMEELDIPLHDHRERRKSVLNGVTNEEWATLTDFKIALKYGCSIPNVRRYRYSREMFKGARR